MRTMRYWREWLALLGLFSLALVLRLYCLDCSGLWYDEVSSIENCPAGRRGDFREPLRLARQPDTAPLLLVWLTIQPVDPAATPILVRLPSALTGALTAPVVYALGREMFGRPQGILAGLLMALSALHISFSQDVRPYAIFALLATMSVYALLVAERTNSPRWWVIFAFTTSLSLFVTYVTLSLLLPALVLYLLWLLFRSGKQKGQGRARIYPVGVLLLIGLASIPALLELADVARDPPNLAILPAVTLEQLGLLFTRLMRLGIGVTPDLIIQYILVVVGVAGLLAAFLRGRSRAAILCLLLILVPVFSLAVLRTSNTVFQRYALFALPFIFLLVANGVVALWSVRVRRLRLDSISRVTGGVLAGSAIAIFLISIYIYYSPDFRRRVNYYPDYRSAARYVEDKAAPGDLIIVLDEPALGSTVMGFYWHVRLPAPAYDARDPLLFQQSVGGSIFWVVSFFQSELRFMDRLADPGLGWAEAARFDRVVVLKEENPQDVLSAMDRMVSRLEAGNANLQPVRTLRGCVEQAKGKVATAQEIYRAAGPYYRLGEEYLRTARGFEAVGDSQKAWREGVIAKFMEPGDPDIHAWLAAHLASSGQPEQGKIEMQLAHALQNPP